MIAPGFARFIFLASFGLLLFGILSIAIGGCASLLGNTPSPTSQTAKVEIEPAKGKATFYMKDGSKSVKTFPHETTIVIDPVNVTDYQVGFALEPYAGVAMTAGQLAGCLGERWFYLDSFGTHSGLTFSDTDPRKWRAAMGMDYFKDNFIFGAEWAWPLDGSQSLPQIIVAHVF